MGKLFSWSELIKSATKKEKYKSLKTKRTHNQINECLILDQLFWIQKSKKPLPESLEKADKNWYCKVMKGAKYSQIGNSFIDPKQNMKCVKIERPDMNKFEPIKLRPSVKKQTIKREYKSKVEIKPQINDRNWIPPVSLLSSLPSAAVIDDQSSCGSSNGGSASLLTASEIVQQARKFLPKLEISPSPCFSNPVKIFQKSSDNNIDVLNYDFSFTSPLIQS